MNNSQTKSPGFNKMQCGLIVSLTRSVSFRLSLARCPALSGSLRLYLALSGSLWLSIALRICLQSPYLAHKALAQLAASLLRYNTLISPDFGYSGKWPNAFGQRDFGEQNQLNLFVMLPPYKESDCDGHKTVQWGDKSLFWWRPSYILHLTEPDGRIKVLEELMPGQLLWRKILGEQKMLQNRWRYHWGEGRHKKLWKFQAFGLEEVPNVIWETFWFGKIPKKKRTTDQHLKKVLTCGSVWKRQQSRPQPPTSLARVGLSWRKMMETVLACLSSWPQVSLKQTFNQLIKN